MGYTKLRRIFTIIAFLICFKPANAFVMLDLVDTPTAQTMFRGEFNIGIWGYENGGLLTRTTLGVHDNIFLGVTFDIENLIGKDQMQLNIPGVIARIKITDGWESFPLSVAIGYDAFYDVTDKTTFFDNNINSRLVFGPYLVLTKPFYLFEQEQHFHLGVRVPIQPVTAPEDTSLFAGIDFPIGPFIPMFEIEKVFFDSTRFGETRFNAGFRYLLYENFAIELNFIINTQEPASRILTFDYTGSF